MVLKKVLWDSNGDADIESRLMGMEVGRGRG